MKKFLIFIVFMYLIIAFPFNIYAFTFKETQIAINGDVLNLQQKPIIQNGSTLAPMRAIFEKFGLSLTWNENERSITAINNNIEIKLNVGSNIAYVNGEKKELLQCPEIINGTTMIPLRFIAESLECTVNWNKNTNFITIISKNYNVNSLNACLFYTEEKQIEENKEQTREQNNDFSDSDYLLSFAPFFEEEAINKFIKEASAGIKEIIVINPITGEQFDYNKYVNRSSNDITDAKLMGYYKDEILQFNEKVKEEIDNNEWIYSFQLPLYGYQFYEDIAYYVDNKKMRYVIYKSDIELYDKESRENTKVLEILISYGGKTELNSDGISITDTGIRMKFSDNDVRNIALNKNDLIKAGIKFK